MGFKNSDKKEEAISIWHAHSIYGKCSQVFNNHSYFSKFAFPLVFSVCSAFLLSTIGSLLLLLDLSCVI
jgi:hypothetical protein